MMRVPAGDHAHQWRTVARVKTGDVIEVTQECTICGLTTSYLEAT